MSETGAEFGYFWNSDNGDRTYDADSFERWLKKFFTTGVFYGDLQVTANNDMTVNVGAGYANIEGKVRMFAASTSGLVVETAHATYDRIDTVVVERNDTDRAIFLKVVKGGYSSDPEPTAPVRSSGVYQIVLAEVYVAAGVTSITQGVITDKRADTAVCGYVVTPVDTFDFGQFSEQFDAYLAEFKANSEADFTEWETTQKSDFEAWEQEQKDAYDTWEAVSQATFDAWFATIQDTLDGDIAGHLLNLIQYLAGQVGIPDEYLQIRPYAEKDYCIHNNTMYRCIKPTTGVFDPNCWEATTVMHEIDVHIQEERDRILDKVFKNKLDIGSLIVINNSGDHLVIDNNDTKLAVSQRVNFSFV